MAAHSAIQPTARYRPCRQVVATHTHTSNHYKLADAATFAAIQRRRVHGVEILFGLGLVSVHEALHAGARLVGHGVRLEVGFEGGGQGQLFNTVDCCVVHDAPTCQLLQRQH